MKKECRNCTYTSYLLDENVRLNEEVKQLKHKLSITEDKIIELFCENQKLKEGKR